MGYRSVRATIIVIIYLVGNQPGVGFPFFKNPRGPIPNATRDTQATKEIRRVKANL